MPPDGNQREKGASVIGRRRSSFVAPSKTPSSHLKNAPVPQHLAQQGLVELEQHARLGPPRDHQVATLGVGREERHFFGFVERAKEEQLCRFLKAKRERVFFSKSFFSSSSLSLLSLFFARELAGRGLCVSRALSRESSQLSSSLRTHQEQRNQKRGALYSRCKEERRRRPD